MSPLPDSRDYDAVDSGPLPHTTVNNLQDGIVDHEANRMSRRQVARSSAAGASAYAAVATYWDAAGRIALSSADGNVEVPIQFQTGDVLTEIKVELIKGLSTSGANMDMFMRIEGGGGKTGATESESPGGGNAVTHTYKPTTGGIIFPYTFVAADDSARVTFVLDVGTPDDFVSWIEFDITRALG